ncbi:hypothetical protein AVEN_75544-1 [Araneus ventricosus]|uniref:Uncharacterized protein n=1 Tax=Araneus ventricosus TaxID=182803 RepID=A0A4Y2DR94_ARAVE|nr:hypothetical protein AVEN_75544-1 [Araneus ventricosus]
MELVKEKPKTKKPKKKSESSKNAVTATEIKELQVPEEDKRYQEDSSTFEILYFVAKVRAPDVAAAGHPILTPVKLSFQP